MTQTHTTIAPKPVPLFELATQYQTIRAEIEAAVKEVLDSQNYTSGAASGPFIGRFESQLGAMLGANVVAVSSGTDAILAAYAWRFSMSGKGHQVITTPFTFFATAGCISRAGAKPVFVDIEPDTFLISLPAIADAVNSNTRAIVPVHLYGQMVDMSKLAALACGPKTRSAAAASATTSGGPPARPTPSPRHPHDRRRRPGHRPCPRS